MRLVIDASVAAKWFNQEELTDQAVKVKERHVRAEVELIAPSHLLCEVANSIWRNPQLADGDARHAVLALSDLGIALLPPEGERLGRTMEIARQKGISFYDAAYIQAAKETDASLITADEIQLKAATGIIQALHLRGMPGIDSMIIR